MPIKTALIVFWAAVLWMVPILASAESNGDFRKDSSRWKTVISTGFDATVHTYPLATQDTTETISEFRVQAGIEGRSKRKTAHRWRVRAEASTGSEMFRERLEGSYRYLAKSHKTVFRMKGYLWGRQYKEGTTYSQSSDNYEGRLDGKVYPLVGKDAALELRGWTSFINYKTPSSLETDHGDQGIGAFVRSQGFSTTMWSLGSRAYSRDYPDSTSIGRDVISFEGDYQKQDDLGRGLNLFHKSERRMAVDETVRPSAWTHWTNFDGAIGVGNGSIFLELQSESWTYDEESTAYFDSWRVDGKMGYRGGDILSLAWHAGFAVEVLGAGDSPESYSQMGLMAGVESYGSDVSGSVALEYGRRIYDNPDIIIEEDSSSDSLDATISLYSDFNYWQIWVMGSWFIHDHLSLDAMASYEPESHTERDDDSALGFASLRLTWRP